MPPPDFPSVERSYRVWGEVWLDNGWRYDEVNHALEELHLRADAGEDDLSVIAELIFRQRRGRLLPGEKGDDREGP